MSVRFAGWGSSQQAISRQQLCCDGFLGKKQGYHGYHTIILIPYPRVRVRRERLILNAWFSWDSLRLWVRWRSAGEKPRRRKGEGRKDGKGSKPTKPNPRGKPAEYQMIYFRRTEKRQKSFFFVTAAAAMINFALLSPVRPL